MNRIFLSASKGADKVRIKLELNMFEPINIYDACINLGISVRFLNFNMEGMYITSNKQNNPNIFLSNQRPLVRRNFTCAHELGHHYFMHGTKVDSLDYSNEYSDEQNYEESLVNTFAGYLLMPIAGLQAQFSIRKWKPHSISPIEFYLLSSYFGVGYLTLIYHCRANKIISFSKAKDLLKYSPAKIFIENFPDSIEKSHFKIFDEYCKLSIVDLEVSNYLILSYTMEIDENYLEIVEETDLGIIYRALKSGIVNVNSSISKKKFLVRIQNKDYIGLAEYRHLETK